uniref:5E5 antigen-like n=1 Tax=Agelaius phoeniceus TaxID=39638 RepID=UPI0023EC23FB|nr:5E5 antigen-like [Agelaius phoeniceus]
MSQSQPSLHTRYRCSSEESSGSEQAPGSNMAGQPQEPTARTGEAREGGRSLEEGLALPPEPHPRRQGGSPGHIRTPAIPRGSGRERARGGSAPGGARAARRRRSAPRGGAGGPTAPLAGSAGTAEAAGGSPSPASSPGPGQRRDRASQRGALRGGRARTRPPNTRAPPCDTGREAIRRRRPRGSKWGENCRAVAECPPPAEPLCRGCAVLPAQPQPRCAAGAQPRGTAPRAAKVSTRHGETPTRDTSGVGRAGTRAARSFWRGNRGAAARGRSAESRCLSGRRAAVPQHKGSSRQPHERRAARKDPPRPRAAGRCNAPESGDTAPGARSPARAPLTAPLAGSAARSRESAAEREETQRWGRPGKGAPATPRASSAPAGRPAGSPRGSRTRVDEVPGAPPAAALTHRGSTPHHGARSW